MARKMKRTPTRAEQAKLRKENIGRATGMKQARERCGKRGVEKEASKEKKRECDHRQAEEGNTCPERNMRSTKVAQNS